MSGLLSKSAILGASDLKHEDVNVPAWGGTVRVRAMNGLERDAFRDAIYRDGKAAPVSEFAAALLVTCIVDESGSRLFSADDMAALQAKSAKSLDAPADVAMRLNGLGGKAVEESVKNSEADQNAASGSGLPKNSAKA